MNALNAIETATNTLPSNQLLGNWELQDELDDTDLVTINGGLVNVLVNDALKNILNDSVKDIDIVKDVTVKDVLNNNKVDVL
ncbi:MAG: hypothetical protein KME49_20595 [Brasilonema octagenarum HA4186-MV1]|jgi:hypothetical protein|nr:hypothetical protein [Brasilonema octagenarum HA4186-MV1]